MVVTLEQVEKFIQAHNLQKVRRHARYITALCPFHQDTRPSFAIYPARNSYYCFGCRKWGRIIERALGKIYTKLPEVSIVNIIDYPNTYLPQWSYYLDGDACIVHGPDTTDYCYQCRRPLEGMKICINCQWHAGRYRLLRYIHPYVEKRVGLSTAIQAGAMYCPIRNMVVFPLFKPNLDLAGLLGRYLDFPKYYYFPGTKVHQAFGAIQFLNKERTNTILVEGIFDALSLISRRIHNLKLANVLAILGSRLSPYQLSCVVNYSRTVYVMLDSDKTGRMASKEIIEMLKPYPIDVRMVILPIGRDPDEVSDDELLGCLDTSLRI